MPISVNWQDENKTILYYEIESVWSLDEAWENLNGPVLELIAEVDYVPDTIMNFTSTQFIPIGLLNFWRHSYQWLQEHHIQTSIVAFVNAPPAMKGIGDTLRNLRVPIMRYMFFVDSVEEGQKLIANFRANSPRKPLDNN